MSPNEIIAVMQQAQKRIAELENKLQAADDRIFFLVAEVSRLNAKLGVTDFPTEVER